MELDRRAGGGGLLCSGNWTRMLPDNGINAFVVRGEAMQGHPLHRTEGGPSVHILGHLLYKGQ